MAFAGGSITFKRFFVDGQAPRGAGESVLERIASRAITADCVRTADHTEIGWTTGEHILDTDFGLEKNAIADGLHFAMRIDTNRPPADLVRSYQKMNEAAMLEASGKEFLAKAQRREAREQALARAEAEAREGAFRRRKAVPLFWDLKRNEVCLGATGVTAADQFALLFRETFDVPVTAASAGEVAARWSAGVGNSREFDDCQPAHFITPPEGLDEAKSALGIAEGQSKDFLGTEWLTWLWYVSHVESPEITIGSQASIPVIFERSLQLQCAFKVTGTIAITAESPTHLPEAPVALAGGKLPIRAGLQIAVHSDVYSLVVRGDMMHFTSVQLPPPEDASTARMVFEDRIEKLRDLIEATNGLYAAFLKRRLSGKWPQTLSAIRSWVAGRESAPVAIGAAS